MRTPRSFHALVAFAVIVASSCSDSKGHPSANDPAHPTTTAALHAEPVARILVVGGDGLEWKVLRPLFAQGKCKNMRALMERGSFGHLATLLPTLSPILWTSIATGKYPQQHGVHGFTDKELKQYTSADRTGRAIWNMADRYGLSSNVFGWWITWPVDEIRGIMVSGSSSSALVDANWKPTLLPGVERQVHPASMNGEVMSIAERAGKLDEVQRLAREKVFGDIPDSMLGIVEKRLIKETLWSIQSDATFYEIARAMMRAHPADQNLVYFGGTDVVGHRFWRYYEPAAFRWPGDPSAEQAWKQMSPESEPLSKILSGPEGMRALSHVIPNYYEWFDEMLGGLMEAAGPDATVIVLSDHGMHASSTDKPNPKFVTGHHQDGAPGVIIAAGPGIVHQGNAEAFLTGKASATHGNILQFAPTMLALLGIPSSADMPAKAELSLLEGKARTNASLAMIASHDVGFRAASKVEVPKGMNEAFVEKFNGLGYIGMEGSEEQGSKLVDPENFTPDTKSPVDDGLHDANPSDGKKPKQH